MDVIKARLSKTKPPYEITRTPGQFDDLSNWKASEFRAFLLYYFTILKDILLLDYFLHFSRLSYASFILMQGEIPRVHVENAGKILQQFVIDMESLYGIEHITSNFHLLTHLAESVLKWGCLWTTSTFIPEWFNGELISLANGTQAVVDQMAFNYLMRYAIRDEALSLLDVVSVPRGISVLFEELLNIKTKTTTSNNRGIGSGSFFLLGSPHKHDLSVAELVSLMNFVSESSSNSFQFDEETVNSCLSFSRIKDSRGCIFCTSSYTRSKKRTNYYALLKEEDFLKIETILHFSKHGRTFLLGKILGKEIQETYTPDSLNGVIFQPIPGQTMLVDNGGNNLLVRCPEDLAIKAVVCSENSLSNTLVITSLANIFETD